MNTHRRFSGSAFLSLSVSLFQTHTRSHTQAVSVRLYGSPVRYEHMEQSFSFQLLVWSFSPSPSEVLCDERVHLGAGTHSLDTCLQDSKNSFSLSGRFPCAFVCIPEGLCVCLRVCTVNKSLWAVGLSRKRNGCENSWGIRRWFSLQPKRWDLHTAQSPDTHSPPVPRWTCICMQSCTHTHKGLFHLHRLPHTFQVISSSVSHFSS